MTACLDKTLQTAVMHQHAGQYAEAIQTYAQALDLAPDVPEIHLNIGSAFLAQGQLQRALHHFHRCIHLQPGFAEAHYNVGVVLARLNRLPQAIASYSEAIALKPDFLPAHFNLANACVEMDLLDKAVGHYETVLQRNPRHVKALTRLGMLSHRLGRPGRAVGLLQQAIQIDPTYDQAHKALGLVYTEQCEFAEAFTCFHTLTQLRPDWADAHCNEGAALNQLGRYTEAIAKYEHAIKLQPDHASAHWNRALLLLLQGRYAEGWPEYRWRWGADAMRLAYPHTYAQPRWEGGDFKGKRLLVHYEQGLGDVLQFIRYLPRVKAQGGTVLFEAPPPIVSLLQDWACIDKLVVSQRKRPVDSPFDLQVSLMDLPALFRTTLDDLPGRQPYIQAPAARVAHWATVFPESGFKVGLVWAGGPVSRQRVASLKLRACQLQHLAPLAEVPDVVLFGLQKGPGSAQVDALCPDFLVRNVGEAFNDFADTAGAIANLDLVISVDTSVAHLAGAMGKPTWVLLKFDADWRWLLERDDSPWYPSMRLFRQGRDETWPCVIEHVRQALDTQVASWRQATCA